MFIKEDNAGTNILIPGLIKKGGSYKDVILGQSTFENLFELLNTDARELKNVISYEGGSAGNSYTNLEFYFGKFGEYYEFTFGIPGLYDEKITDDYTILSDRKPKRVLIK